VNGMNDLVERTCEVLTGDNGVLVVYNNQIGAQEAFANLNPYVCGKPAFSFVDYGDHRVWMCLEHFTTCNSSPKGPIDIAGLGWKYIEDRDDSPPST
jgi:hypothetical protein